MGRRMKKCLLVVMVIAIALGGMLAGCGGGEERTTPDSFEEQAVTQEISKNQSETVILDDGLKIDLPAGCIYDDHDTLTVTSSQEPPPVDPGSLEFVGTFYEIDLESGDFFNGVVQVDIPYDEAKLPADRTEAEIFAVFSAEREWHRVYGDVDTDRNILTVYTIHNGFWSTAIDKVANFAGKVADFFSGRNPNTEDLEKARENVRRYRSEFLAAVEELESPDSYLVEGLLDWSKSQLEGLVVLKAVEGGLEAWAGKTVVVGKATALGSTVGIIAAWSGIAYGALNVMAIAEETGAAIADRIRLEIALDRLIEAEAILWALEHPDVQTFPPDYQEALQDYVAAMPIDQTVSSDTPIDFDFTAYPYVSTVSLTGVVSREFTTDGGTFSISVSPKDEGGNLITRGVTVASFTFEDITIAESATPQKPVAHGSAQVTGINIMEARPGEQVTLVLVLVFDSSGSMDDNDRSRFRVDAGKQLVSLLKAYSPTAVIDFGAGSSGGLIASRLLQDLTSTKALLENAIDQVTADGDTPLFDSLLEALGMLRGYSSSNASVLVLTDGKDTDSTSTSTDVVLKANSQGMPVFVIGLGESVDFTELQDIARDTGGTFAEARDARALGLVYKNIRFGITEGPVVVTGEGRFSPRLTNPGKYVVSGVLVTTIGGVSTDTPFSFTIWPLFDQVTTPQLPSPDVVFTGAVVDFTGFTQYRLSVSNWRAYPDELFVSAPDLPPCGLNTNASRTWVYIYDGKDSSYLEGFCGLGSPADLEELWFYRPEGEQPPDSVYVVLVDRRGNINYQSDLVYITQPGDTTVTFADLNLEAVIREAIGKPIGRLYQSDLEVLANLNATHRGIHDLDGLEHCSGLIKLVLNFNQISDLSPLSNLMNLRELHIAGNQISDISPLSSLTNLRGLDVSRNQIYEIGLLSRLTGLTWLSLNMNPIRNISRLSNLKNLTSISIYGCQISDISALSNLTNLAYIDLTVNQISDISPLINNYGIGNGDTVVLRQNPLSTTSTYRLIPRLEQRGVRVFY